MRVRSRIMIGSLLGLTVCAATSQSCIQISSVFARSASGNGDRTKKIESTLDSPCEVNFTDIPLKDAVEYLAAAMRIPISIDVKSLSDEGVSADTTVTLVLSGVSLRNVLHLLLEPLLLTSLTEDGVLRITTMSVAEQKYCTREYLVRDMVEGHAGDESVKAYSHLSNVIRSSAGGRWDAENNLQKVERPEIEADTVLTEAPPGRAATIEGAIRPHPDFGTLEIRQTQRVHREIRGLLTAIRKAKRYGGYQDSRSVQVKDPH